MSKLPRQPRPIDSSAVRRGWAREHAAARHARVERDSAVEWAHLERAHVLSQPLAVAHVRTHVAMLGYGIRHRDQQEIEGQLIRALLAAPSSLARRYPLGNTGGANVSPVEPMSIAPDLRAILQGIVEVSP